MCGKPLQTKCKSSSNRILIAAVTIGIGIILVGVAVFIYFFILRSRRQVAKSFKPERIPSQKRPRRQTTHDNKVQSEDHTTSVVDSHSYKKKDDNGGSLNFVRDDRKRFDLHDLLRASAEVLGSGSFGSSYKANMMIGESAVETAVVVKRFRHMSNLGKDEFCEHMKKLGRVSHPNLLPLVAFYYRREEKLLVSDFIENGSLASHLHSNNLPFSLQSSFVFC